MPNENLLLDSFLRKEAVLSSQIEQQLGEPNVVLDSFTVSNSPSHVMRKQWDIEKTEMAKRHIVFQDEDKETYIGTVLRE